MDSATPCGSFLDTFCSNMPVGCLLVDTQKKRIASAMAAIVEELRMQRKLSQEELAGRSGIPYGSYRNIARATVDVKIPDLVAIAAALSTTPLPGGDDTPVLVTAADMVDAAVERSGGFTAVVSEAFANTDDLRTRRLQREAEKMSAAEIERRAIAAQADDPETRTDEAPST